MLESCEKKSGVRRHLGAAAAIVAALTLATASGAASAATVAVSGQSATPTLIANLLAGTSYTISVTGVVDLLNGFNGGSGLTFTADGRPTYSFPYPYTSFYPVGATNDPTTGAHGAAYNLNIGALVGSYTATPATGAASTDFFLIGLGTTLTPTANVSLYGLVNDTDYRDNGPGAFQVTINAVPGAGAVPEPATWAMMIAGFGMIGASARYRRRSSKIAYA